MTQVIATVVEVHRAWAWVVIIGNGLAGFWTLAAAKIPALRSRALWWFVIFVEAAIGVQVLLGIEMITAGHLKAPFFHYFYGIVALVAIVAMAFYRMKLTRKRYWLYGFGGLFLMGVGIRAMIVVLAG